MLVTQVNCEFVSVQAAAVFADLTVQLQLLVCAFGLEAVIFCAACEVIVIRLRTLACLACMPKRASLWDIIMLHNDSLHSCRHLPRIHDYLWVAEDGMKMQVTISWCSCRGQDRGRAALQN